MNYDDLNGMSMRQQIWVLTLVQKASESNHIMYLYLEIAG